MKNFILRTTTLTLIFLKEQCKEPIALFWIILSPCAMYYLIVLSKNGSDHLEQNYRATAGWYFSYVACSVALFGFSLYIIGRRESGFIRCFVYDRRSRLIFLTAQFLACTLIAITYCVIFYLASRPLFGSYDMKGLVEVMVLFYICYLCFCIPGLIIALLPVSFQTANTLMSVTSFSLLGMGLAGSIRPDSMFEKLNIFNPIMLANAIMVNGFKPNAVLVIIIILTFIATLGMTHLFFRINPVWNRH